MIASGVVKSARALGTKIPVVIRLEGTNVDQGKKILAESGLAFSSADGMKEAAERIVALVKEDGPKEPLMSILLDEKTRVVVLGITGSEGHLPRPPR